MQKKIKIMGIDPGLRNMGWGVIETDGVRLSYVASGVVKSASSGRLSERLACLFDGLTEQLNCYHPHEAAVEQTFVNKGATATLKLGQARGIALLAPAMLKIDVAEYAPNLVKKTVTGAGHADKHQIHTMLKILLPQAAPGSDDEADALAIAITHAHNRATFRSRELLVG